MSPSEYSNHTIRDLLDRLNGLVLSPELTDPDVVALETNATAIQSVATIVGATRSLMERTPPQFVSGYGLTQLQSGFQTTFNELSAFQANKNPGHLQNARAQIEQSVMPQLWSFGPTIAADGLAPVANAVTQITTSVSESIQQLIQQRDVFASRFAALTQQLQDAQLRLESLTETVAQQKAEATSVVAVVQQQYAEKEAERVTAFEATLKELRGDFGRMQSEAEAMQAERLNSLRTSQDQAAQIVQVVGNIGVTGNYQKIANNEGEQANLWRKITIAFFCTGIAVAIATFVKFWNQPFTPENAWSVLIRLMYALAITAPAWYTARESARHRTNADRARQVELELASLGPFIELLPDETKNQIREELTKRYFGNQISEHTAEPPVNIKELRDFALELVKAAKK